MIRFPTILSVLPLLLGACATQEILEPIDGTVPVGVDLSGSWSIRAAAANDQRRLRDAIRKTDGVRDGAISGKKPGNSGRQGRPSAGSSRSSRSGRVKGGLVYVFLETGDALKVTQTQHALFVSFDRSVVEEFRFGENRIIRVGEVEAQRVTGWENTGLTVQTLDRNGMKLTERYRLIDAGKTLQRLITFRSKALEEETILQEYDRTD